MHRALALRRALRPASAALMSMRPMHGPMTQLAPIASMHPSGGASWAALMAAGVSTTAVMRASQTVSAEAAAAAGSDKEIVLYQYEVCPFCNKVRAYLDYHNISYRVVEVDPLKKSELSVLEGDYRKVPIAVIDGTQVNGSGEIIRAVGGGSDVGDDWVRWVDDELIRLLTPNIYRTPGEALQTFAYIADHAKFSAWQRASIRYFGAAAMYMVARKKKKQYGIADERAEMADALRSWTDAIGDGKFLAGDKPGLADLCVYGVMRAIQDFDTFAEMSKVNPQFAEWYHRTQAAVGDTARVEAIA